MNRLIRGILYIVAGCAGIGCAALILGLVLGRGKVELEDYGSLNFAKNSAYNIVVKVENKLRNWLNRNEKSASSAESVDGSGLNVGFVEERGDEAAFIKKGSKDSEWYEEEDGEQGLLTVSTDQIKQLDLDIAHGSLSITESNSDEIYVWTESDVNNIEVTCENDKIVIRDRRTGNKRREDADIYMEIPSTNQFQNVKIQVAAGCVDIENRLNAQKFTLNADAGEITAQMLTSNDFSASVGAGTIEVVEGAFGSIKLDCGVGTIDLYGLNIESDAEISCGMGAVEVELQDDPQSFNYQLSCGLGEIEIRDNSYSALASEKRIDNGAGRTFTLNCGMGSITIE